jgi:hypothetical protein
MHSVAIRGFIHTIMPPGESRKRVADEYLKKKVREASARHRAKDTSPCSSDLVHSHRFRQKLNTLFSWPAAHRTTGATPHRSFYGSRNDRIVVRRSYDCITAQKDIPLPLKSLQSSLDMFVACTISTTAHTLPSWESRSLILQHAVSPYYRRTAPAPSR